MTTLSKIATVLAIAMAGAPLTATAQDLPGVSDEEVSSIAGGVEDFHRGDGDSLYVRNRFNRWYRLQLNDGCLDTPLTAREVAFNNSGPTNRVTLFTRVSFIDSGRYWGRGCTIESIRRSVAPPQVDSKSPIKLD